MRYAKIKEMDVSNGEGIGVSLFVQGCHFHCHGCFNPETWDFDGGKEWTPEIENKFVELAGRQFIKRISILGGEPLADENVTTVYRIVKRLRETYTDKKIWIYTGYLWDDICSIDTNYDDYFGFINSVSRFETVKLADIVVDGRFQLQNQDLYNEKIVWAGSTNQRVIDVKSQLDKLLTDVL